MSTTKTYGSQPVFHCHAKEFYADPDYNGQEFQRVPIIMTTGDVIFEVFQKENDTFSGTFQTLGELKQEISDAPIKTDTIVPSKVGVATFYTALSYLSIMLNQKEISQADSYKSFQVLAPSGNVYFVGLEIFKDQIIIGRALLFPVGQIVGVCE